MDVSFDRSKLNFGSKRYDHQYKLSLHVFFTRREGRQSAEVRVSCGCAPIGALSSQIPKRALVAEARRVNHT
jgi:hypothetical protein